MMIASSITCWLKASSSDSPGPAMGYVHSSSSSFSNPIAEGGGGGNRGHLLVPPLSLWCTPFPFDVQAPQVRVCPWLWVGSIVSEAN